MSNLLEQAINVDDGERVAKIIQEALVIDTDDVVNYTWPSDREQRAGIIGEWLQTEARFWPRDALYAVLSVRIAFGHPWRCADLAYRFAVDWQDLMPGSRRRPGPSRNQQCFLRMTQGVGKAHFSLERTAPQRIGLQLPGGITLPRPLGSWIPANVTGAPGAASTGAFSLPRVEG